jgi:hydroxyethylthiazole kinase
MANAIKTPIILDPVGAGASDYRTSSCQALLNEFDIAFIRGNASEIMALAGLKLRSKGVDSLEETRAAIESALVLANQYQLCVVISGETDIIVGNQPVQTIESGSPLIPYVTGTGCLLSAVVAAFDAVCDDPFHAAHAATLFYGVCGEIAARKASTPAAFKSHFLDALFTMPMREDYATK